MKTTTILKKAFLISSLSLSFCACELDQLPQDQMTPENSLKNETELKLYINGLLPMLSGASNVDNGASVAAGKMMEKTDDVIWPTLPDYMTGKRSSTQSAGSWDWDNLRKINIFLKYSVNCPDETIREKYNAMAYYLRAQFYYDKLKTFGGVPWYDTVLEDNSPELYKPRDSRELIADKILEDLDKAIKNGVETKSLNEITKWTALALKSRFCLFEGTFRQYHTLEGSEKFLKECVAASEAMMISGKYTIDKGEGTSVAYRDLFAQPATNSASDVEVITAYAYSISLGVKHNTNYSIINASGNQIGLSKAFMDSYLMNDGTRFTDKPGYATMIFGEEFENRDPRMFQTVRCPGYARIGKDHDVNRLYEAMIISTTGYMPIKYIQSGDYDKQTSNENDIILYRYAEVLLNYAEAKAELGTLTQTDLEQSIKLIRDRVGMPNMNMAAANANPDPVLAAQYPLVSGSNKGVILEIRRERRVEMVMEDLRYDDIIRWKAGHLFKEQFKGAYFSTVSAPSTKYDLDKPAYTVRNANFYIYIGERPGNLTEKNSIGLNVGIFLSNGNSGNKVVNTDKVKTWNEDRDYLAPLPSSALVINPNLKQNPHWDSPSN